MAEEKNILSIDTVNYDEEKGAIVIIDQTRLPYEQDIIDIRTQEEVWKAINILQVRGAPAIGVCAGYGLYMAARDIDTVNVEEFRDKLQKAADYLDSSRPTAVNLSWALKRMMRVCNDNLDLGVDGLKERLYREARAIHAEDTEMCRKIGEYGLSLVKPGDGLLTHCNAGQLATSKYGTATAPMFLGFEKGYNFHVFCDETRPLLQGARLTAYELKSAGLDVTLICDNMSATVMRKGWVNAVFVGCDRMAANGDFANKIGTSVVAICAKRYNVPFYVCLPTSSIDMSLASGEDIVIEERPAEEVTEMWYAKRMAPEGVKVFNPAFDVTDHDLIAGIVTEHGVIKPPFDVNLKALFDRIGK